MEEDGKAPEEDRKANDLAGAKRLLSLARLLLSKGGALQSTAAGERIDRTQLAEALQRRVEMNTTPLPPPTAKAVAAEVLTNAENALNKTAGGASPSILTDLEIASLEAIIEETGRPAMRYADGRVQMPPSDLGENDRWRVLIATARSKINKASASVGRIAIADNTGLSQTIGTGWCAAGGLIVTNRHVVRELVTDPNNALDLWTLDPQKRPSVDFTATEVSSTLQRFEITELVYCAVEENIDMAFLRVNTVADPLPPALALDWEPESVGSEHEDENGEFQGHEIYVVGHPYRRRNSELVAAVFGVADGSKRWSPGLVVGVNAIEPLIEHDCSTLGGNSGACVFTVGRHEVLGVHIGGAGVDEDTGRGRANLAIALSRLGGHRVVALLQSGQL
jgi:hypothetical protein